MSAIDPIAVDAQGTSRGKAVARRTSYRLKWRKSKLTTRGTAFRLFFTCWLVFALHFATNSVREIYPALTLGDHLSFDVSEYAGLHPDIFLIPGRGAFINNNPGASIIGAIPYTISRPITDQIVHRITEARRRVKSEPTAEYKSIYPLAREFYREAQNRGLDVKLGLGAAVMQALAMAPISAASVVLMFYVLLALTNSPRRSLLLSLLFAFATPIFYRTAQLNQNLLVAHCAFFAFVALWRPWDDPQDPKRPRFLLAGLLCGWAVVLDYSGLVVALVVTAYALTRWISLPRDRRYPRDVAYFATGLGVCAAVLMLYQWSSFGNPFLPAQSYMPPTQLSEFGYRGMDWPRWDLFWDTAFSARFGLLTSAPLLLLACYLPAWFSKRFRILNSREIVLIAAFALLFLTFCAANQYGRLQFNSGVRYALPVVPFLFLIVSSVMLRMRPVVAFIVGVTATYWSWCLSMYRDVEQGTGIFESVKQITLHGPRFPWLTSLANMGYTSDNPPMLLLLLTMAVVIGILWKLEIVQVGRTNPA